MSNLLFIDFESRSTVDLKACGADIYGRHPSTEVMACGFAFNDEKVEILELGERPNARIIEHIKAGYPVIGHNTIFEWIIFNFSWRRHFPDLPELKIEQCFCTMAMAYAMGLPGSLEKAAPAAGITLEKDMKGQRTMLQLSQPKTSDPLTWYCPIEFEDKYSRMYEYCKVDVEVERQLYRRLLPLSIQEREMWLLDHKINQRGVCVDLASAKSAIEIVNFEQKRLNEEIREVTNNGVATTSSNTQLTQWLKSRGVKLEGVAKSDVTDLLEGDGLPDNCSTALQIRREAAKSSTAKFLSLVKRCSTEDQRMRSNLQYHGATTGRWAGRGFQLHNLPRSKLTDKEIEGIFGILQS